ncbi:MAG: hypothetical protein BroJett026_32570 [Betaproteobacteria bacterium]|nr:MAG: hypothetical protein BroJett026_32570 [Betaproteobacteria bacterium]
MLLQHRGAAAPRQEAGIVLDVVDQREHLLRAVRDEDGLADALHGALSRMGPRVRDVLAAARLSRRQGVA